MQTEKDLDRFFEEFHTEICETLQREIQEKNAIKWHGILKVEFIKTVNEEIKERASFYFSNSSQIQLTSENLAENINIMLTTHKKNIEDFVNLGSNWIFNKIQHLELKSAKYIPLHGGKYIATPDKLKAKKALINVQNHDDNKCIIWALLAHKLKIEKNPERVTKYIPQEKEIILNDVTCPVPYTDIKKIEEYNNLRINIFIYDETEEICPLYISNKEDEDVINLLLLEDMTGNQHYIYIKHFSRLLGHVTQHHSRSFYCYRCLHRFSREDLLKEHTQYCRHHQIQAIKMPTENKKMLSFTNIQMQHRKSFIVYADFESILNPVSTAAQDPQTSYTVQTAKHIPCGYAYLIVGPDGKSYKPIQVYRGENAVDHFLEAIIQEKDEIAEKLNTIVPMRLTPAEEKSFQEATRCCICKNKLYKARVRDHCHLSGVYRGASHIDCNLKYKQPKSIPVIFHNSKNYDTHMLMTRLGKLENHRIVVIPNTMEKYIAFQLIKNNCPVKLIFMDSLQFLPSSLEKLVQAQNPDQFNLLKENFPPTTNFNLLLRKGVYPYAYITDFSIFGDTELPPSRAFHNDLTGEDISPEDYVHAQNVWNAFNIQNLGEYHDLYVKTDVLLLGDVFENFRKLCLTYYDLDPTHCFTAPGLSWQACLKMTGVDLELFTDIDMLLFIEQGVRGGVSMVSHRHAKANIPNTAEYDSTQASQYIMYWDANNLYGWAMSQYLPYGGFKWVNSENFTTEDILQLKSDIEEGYIFEVDLEYPQHLHDLHNEYPLAPEPLEIKENMLSKQAKYMLKGKKFTPSTKLTPNLYNKTHYVTHYRNLQFYLQQGLKLTKIHKVLSFKQAPWLQPYISFNTDKRKNSKTTFEKDFFKLLNNAVFGKTIENLRKRRNIELCNSSIRAEKIVASPLYTDYKIFDENLAAVERVKSSILMNRPVYVGFTVLELAKVLMYSFHYNYMKKTYQNKAQLLFTDTDSLTYHITTPDIYKDMENNIHHFDTSDYPQNDPLYSTVNKKVIGKFKDELNGRFIYEFVGLKAKMYSIRSQDGEKKTLKGISKSYVKKKISHEDYLNCLRNLKTSIAEQTRIAQEKHRIYTIKQNKISLSPFDDKRYILEDYITSRAYGHYRNDEEN